MRTAPGITRPTASSTDPSVGAIGYDTHGNTTTLGTQTLSYDGAGRHMATTSASGSAGSVSVVGATAATVTYDNKLVVPMPTGVAQGDLILVAVTQRIDCAVSTPAGVTLVGAYTGSTSNWMPKVSVFKTTATASQGAITVNSCLAAHSGVAIVLRGADATNPIEAVSSAGAEGKNMTVPGLTTTTANDRLLMVMGAVNQSNPAGFTPPAGMTEQADANSVSYTTTAVAEEARPTPGATGSRTAAFAVNLQLAAALLAVKPAATGTTVAYTRDATGRIVARNQNGTRTAAYGHTGLGDGPAVTLDPAGAVIERQYALPGAAGLTIRGSSQIWSYPNIHGDVSATADSTGTRTATFGYDPYGNPTSTLPENSAGDFDYGWLGSHQKQTEHAPGLQTVIEMGARPYLPGLGRFLQVDPIEGGSCNDYDYTCADPINNFDLTGLFFVDGYHAATWALMYQTEQRANRYTRKAAEAPVEAGRPTARPAKQKGCAWLGCVAEFVSDHKVGLTSNEDRWLCRHHCGGGSRACVWWGESFPDSRRRSCIDRC